MSLPVVQKTFSCVDNAAGHVQGGYSVIPSAIAAKNGELAYVYRENASNVAYLVRVDLESDDVALSRRLFLQAANASEGVHIFPTAEGYLALLDWDGQAALNLSSNSLPPRHRFLTSLEDDVGWTPEAGLPSRSSIAGFDAPTLAKQFAPAGVFDELTQTLHLLFSCEAVGPLDVGVPVAVGGGLSYYRILPGNVTDGPYVLVRGATGQPPGAGTPGDSRGRGAIVLGYQRVGKRSIFILWCRHYLWASGAAMHQFDVFVAASHDGGDTWQNLNGTQERTKYEGIAWDDEDFLEISTDHNAATVPVLGYDGGLFTAAYLDQESKSPMFGLAIPNILFIQSAHHNFLGLSTPRSNFLYQRGLNSYSAFPTSFILEPGKLFMSQDGSISALATILAAPVGLVYGESPFGSLTLGNNATGLVADQQSRNKFYTFDGAGVVRIYEQGPLAVEDDDWSANIPVLDEDRELRLFSTQRALPIQAVRTLRIQDKVLDQRIQ